MKCANEMNVLVNEALEKQRLAEERERARLEQENLQAKIDAIAHCENTIAKELEKEAQKGCTCVVLDYSLEQGWGGVYPDCIMQLATEKRKYANGKKSYCPYGERIHLPTVVRYLRDNCYKVDVHEHGHMRYGSGYHSGIRLVIRIPSNPCV